MLLFFSGGEEAAASLNSITSPANVTYVGGSVITYVFNYSRPITVTGTPTVTINFNSTGKTFSYSGGTGTTAISFSYTVQNNDTATSLTSVSPISLAGGSMKDSSGNDAPLTFTGDTISRTVDAVLATISSVTPPSNADYTTGQNIDFVVNFSRAVTVTGSPRISLSGDSGGTRYATYQSGSPGTAITFRYTVQSGDLFQNGITTVSPIGLNSGTINSSVGVAATLTFTGTAYPSVRVNPVANKVKVVTWTGTGSAQSINVGYSPGMVMIKVRSTTGSHLVFDSVRGATKYWGTTGGSETTDAQSITAFTATGFNIGTSSAVNTNAATYVAFCWPEQADLFDIVNYTGNGTARTIAHSLTSAPQAMWFKGVTTGTTPTAYHTSIGNTGAVFLSLTNATNTNDFFNNTSPTSSVFSVGTQANTNTNSENMLAYLFAAKAGEAAFGTYTGNGSTQTINTGFQADLVIIKGYTNTQSWLVFDAVRTFPQQVLLNSTGAEATFTGRCTVNASGFGIGSSTAINETAQSYAYMAFKF